MDDPGYSEKRKHMRRWFRVLRAGGTSSPSSIPDSNPPVLLTIHDAINPVIFEHNNLGLGVAISPSSLSVKTKPEKGINTAISITRGSFHHSIFLMRKAQPHFLA